jgi:putative transcriptional regulator
MENRLRELREEHGISQRELAEEVGVTRQTINAVERGRYDPSLDLAFELGDFFGCYAEDIFLYDADEDGL